MGVALVSAHRAGRGHGVRIEARRYRPTGDQGPDQRLLAARQVAAIRHTHTSRAAVVMGMEPAAAAIASSSSKSSAVGG